MMDTLINISHDSYTGESVSKIKQSQASEVEGSLVLIILHQSKKITLQKAHSFSLPHRPFIFFFFHMQEEEFCNDWEQMGRIHAPYSELHSLVKHQLGATCQASGTHAAFHVIPKITNHFGQRFTGLTPCSHSLRAEVPWHIQSQRGRRKLEGTDRQTQGRGRRKAGRHQQQGHGKQRYLRSCRLFKMGQTEEVYSM